MAATCLDEASVLSFLAGTLPPEARAEVEVHVAACSGCAEILTWAAADSASASRAPGREGAPFIGQLVPGARVDRYQILGPVGRGGMGEVYAAYHPDLDRRIALKIVFESGADATERRARLLREARAIARLSHPNVVTVFDAGTVGDRVYIAMEFVDGETLDAWLAAKPRGWAEILDVFVAAGRGLAAAHAAKIIHRDFKPQNVMIAKDGVVRVMDFGLAQLVTEEDAAGNSSTSEARIIGSDGSSELPRTVTRATKTGALLGTPAYMAPEQWQGRPIDARADQFSFAVAFHEALYGERPRLAHVDQHSGPSTTSKVPSIGQNRRSVPGWLREVLERALDSDRERRFVSMDHLLTSLTRARARTRRRMSTFGAALVIAFGTLAAWRLSHARSVDCTPPRDRITAAWPAPDSDSGRRRAIRSALMAKSAEDPEPIWQRLTATLDAYVGQWSAMYRETCESTHVRHEQSAEVLGLRMHCLDDRLDEVRALTDGLASARELTPSLALAATSEVTPVSQCADVGMLQSATPLPADERTARTVEALKTSLRSVDAQFDLGRCSDGLAQALNLRPAVEATEYKPLLGELLERIGRLQIDVTDPETAERTLRDAIVVAISGGDNVTAAKAVSGLVYVIGDLQGRPGEAHEWAKVGHALLDHCRAPHYRVRGWLKQDEGCTLMRERRFEEALSLSREAQALKERELGPDHPDVGLSVNTQGVALMELGRHAEGLAAFTHALEIFTHRGGPVSTAISNRAEELRLLGRTDEARASFERALATDPQRLHRPYPMIGLGRTLADLGDPRRAIPWFEGALRIRGPHDTDPPSTAEARFALASALWDTGGDRTRALSLAKAAKDTYEQLEMNRELAQVNGWLAKHGSRPPPP